MTEDQGVKISLLLMKQVSDTQVVGQGTSYKYRNVKWHYELDRTNSTLTLFEESITHLKKCGFWNKMPFNFQMTLLSTITCQKTYLHDFSIILKSINKDKITLREVALLKKIGNNALEWNSEYKRSYEEKDRWKDYDDSNFRTAEKLYADGRDYFVTLQDASNASSRLSDYISTLVPITTNNISQQITGNMNVVTGINNGDISVDGNSYHGFEEESKQAIRYIEKLEDVRLDVIEYIKDLLLETSEAIKADDKVRQENCKSNYKGFLIGAGTEISNIIGVLGSFASIASFFGIGI